MSFVNYLSKSLNNLNKFLSKQYILKVLFEMASNDFVSDDSQESCYTPSASKKKTDRSSKNPDNNDDLLVAAFKIIVQNDLFPIQNPAFENLDNYEKVEKFKRLLKEEKN